MHVWLIVAAAALLAALAGYWLGSRADEDPFDDADTGYPGDPDFSAESSYATLLQSLDAAVLCVDPHDVVVAANSAAAKLFDATLERMLGRATIEATSSVEIDRRVADARRGQATRENIELTSSRHSYWVDLRIEPLSGGGALVIAHDVTDLREHERIRREFLGNISHELRTPLAGIKLMFETVEAIDDKAARDHFYPQIRTEIDRLVEIVEHLLEVARAEGGRVELKREPVQLDELAASTLAPMEARLSEGEIAVTGEFSPAPMTGDSARLRQVLVNLIENALRHTSPGGRIMIRTRREGDTAVLEVEDTGSGIPFKDLPHIFERFYVVDRSRAKPAAGLGLGLALVKATVEAHGGEIQVSSELGRGSIFRLIFAAR